MISRGAKNVSIWSRSGKSSPEAAAVFSELNKNGANVTVERCDITDRNSINSAMSLALAQPHQIKGIIHAAVTFCDQAFEKLEYDQWRLGLSAKVTGTENLHQMTLDHKLALDFFVLTSSYEAVVALPTQAAYCAANSFQDAFARYRRAIGLPACAIALGLITEIGEAAQRDITRTMIDRNNLYGTPELGTLQLLEAAFLDYPSVDQTSSPYASHWSEFDPLAQAQITTCLEPTKLAKKLEQNGTAMGAPRWTTDKKFSHIMQAVTDSLAVDEQTTQSQVQEEGVTKLVDDAIRAGQLNEACEILTSATKTRIAGLLRLDAGTINSDKSVAEYGVDSLIAVELRNWFVTTLQSTIPLLRLLDESVSLFELVGGMIQERYTKLTG